MAKHKNKIDVDIANEAIQIVKEERESWEDATAFVTEKIAFVMRNLIKSLRKNYWGIFDTEIDSLTGRKKIWIPLTESLVESVVKNIDLDSKDISMTAKKIEGIPMTEIVRGIVKNELEEIYFGEKLDMLERDIAIDGTKVWKTLEVMDKESKKKTINIKTPDLLNCYIDPTAESIQDAYRFTERALLTVEEIQSMDWINTEGIQGVEGLHKSETELTNSSQSKGTKFLDVWETWGKIPKSLITGNKKDKDEEIEGHIVVSGIENKGSERVHLIEENKTGLKPYEEAWYQKVSGRWYGRGIAEKVMWLQLWINTVVNIRINRSYVSQLGIFKIKEGRGITPQMISKLAANGAITVKEQDDIEQMVIQEASAASYKDEDIIQSWAERVTSAFEVVTGETLAASTTATAIQIQGRNAQSQFVMIKKGIGMFLKRWLKRHAIPIMMKNVRKDDIVKITGELSSLQSLDDRVANEMLYSEIERVESAGGMVTPEDIAIEKQRIVENFTQMGSTRFYKILEDIDLTEYDVHIDIASEEIDKGVLAQNLMTALQAAPEFRNVLLMKIFDVMGLDTAQLREAQQNVGQQIPQEQGQPQQRSQNPQEVLTNANVR